jgi:hypothetical protein
VVEPEWKLFIEHACYGTSVEACIGFRKNDQVTYIHGWALSNKPDQYDIVLPSRGIRMLQTKPIPWTKEAIPPLRLFFKILDDGKILLLHIEEDKESS